MAILKSIKNAMARLTHKFAADGKNGSIAADGTDRVGKTQLGVHLKLPNCEIQLQYDESFLKFVLDLVK